MLISKSFGSDNHSGAHSDVIKALNKANIGDAVAYGADHYTEVALKKFHRIFGKDADIYFVFGGTPANVLGLKAITEPQNAIICADIAHINVDECGAPERFTGCKLLPISTKNGKITVDGIKSKLIGVEDEHRSQPKVVSITQATEYGTVYSIPELKKIAGFVHKNDLFLHMDGARLANAAASLDTGLNEITGEIGVDVLSFGGTKNGMLYGEAVVFFNKALSTEFKFIRKQGMQLPSKMRFISSQFDALLSNNLWLKNARHANDMAKRLSTELANIPEIRITQIVEANSVFAIIPKRYITAIQKEYFFYVWNENTSEVRLMTSFDTDAKDVDAFVKLVKGVIRK